MAGSRQVVAIMFTDIVGYSALTQRNEALALELLETHWKLLRPVFAACEGREIKTIGDAFLIEFPSALQAVRAGLGMQAALRDYNAGVEEGRQLHIRIGIHLGDVERRGDDVFGDGVNIASRIEPLAPADGLCISEAVYSNVHNKVDVPFHSLGACQLKNIAQPVVVYSTRGASAEKKSVPAKKVLRIAAVAALLAAIPLVVWKNWPPQVGEPAVATRTRASVPPAEEPGGKSIAVLPFSNLSNDPGIEALAAGLHDDLLTQISKIHALKTISRTSVMQYQGTTKAIPEIGRELGVTHVLESGIQSSGDRIRLNAQLIEAASDKHLWAETYERQLTAANLFSIQGEVATAIATALKVALEPEERVRLQAIATENFEAHEAYHLGKAQLPRRTKEAFARAAEHFQQAVRLDPGFALAYVGLADTYTLQGNYGFLDRTEQLAKAEVAVRKALALDDRIGEAYASLGLIQDTQGKKDEAEAAFRRALELSPNYASAYQWYGLFLQDMGRNRDARTKLLKAAELDPGSAIIRIGLADLLAELGQSEEAVTHLQEAIALNRDYPRLHVTLARIQMYGLGRYDQGLMSLEAAVVLDESSWVASYSLAMAYTELGDYQRAEEWLERAAAIDEKPSLRGRAHLNWAKGNWDALREIGLEMERTMLTDPNACFCPVIYPQQDLKAGRAPAIRAMYERRLPALLNDPDPQITSQNLDAAIDLALVLKYTGEEERANLLLERSLEVVRGRPPGWFGLGLNEAVIQAMLGRKKEALAALQVAFNAHYRGNPLGLENSLEFESLREEPEFKAIVTAMREDLAGQLERVRERGATLH